ncbi:adenylate/guanylate cyclase domain-containing protein [Bdellovibrionota bacterium FG-1]
MRMPFGRKLNLFVALSVLVIGAAAGGVGRALLARGLSDELKQSVQQTNALVAARVQDDLKDLAERALFFAPFGVQDPAGASSQKFFTGHEELLGLSVIHISKGAVLFRWTRPDRDPGHLTTQAFDNLDIRQPVDLNRIAQGGTSLSFGVAKDQAPFMRLGVPYGEKGPNGFEFAVVVEARPQKILAIFSEIHQFLSFLVGPSGRLVAMSQTGHFSQDEDLSKLPLLNVALTSGHSRGYVEYSETPGGPVFMASYQRILMGPTALWVFTQNSQEQIGPALRSYSKKIILFTFVLISLAWAWTHWSCWRYVGAPIKDLREQLDDIRVQKGAERLVRPLSNDTEYEIRQMADLLEAIYTDQGLQRSRPKEPEPEPDMDLEGRENNPSSAFAKFKDPALRARLEAGEIPIQGERLNTFFLAAHLQGIEKIVPVAHAEKLLRELNEFNRATADAIEGQGGVIDRMSGNTVLAFWGLPEPQATDPEQIMTACLKIRKAATRLNKTLEGAGWPKATLSMGLHYGPVVAGQIGSPNRSEYSAVGEAVEYAERIQSFADQFGTDLLITAAAADRIPSHYSRERVTAGDDQTPELFELALAA